MEKSPQQESWRRAMDEEFSNLKLRNVWKLTKLPPDKQLLGCRWVYNLKRDENGKVIRYKARLVAQGYSQIKGENYDETFSPVVNFSVIRLFFSLLVVWLKWKHFQCDVTGAYLYAPLNEEVYMKQPQGYIEKGKEGLVCKLKQALYGLHQSGRAWYIDIEGFSDADFAANRDDRVSMGGQFICLGNAPITSRTFKEKSVSLSTMEAEFMSMVECIKEITWLDNIMNECASRDVVKYRSKPVLLADNQAAIDFLKSPIENYRTKHIEVRYHYVRDLLYKGLFEVKYVKSSALLLMLAFGWASIPFSYITSFIFERDSAAFSVVMICHIFVVVSYRVLKMEVNKEKIWFFLQFFFDKGENASKAAEIVNGVYVANTVTANYVQFWFRRFGSGIFDVKDAPRMQARRRKCR
ncbi:retrovirus-related Pol polyprotein from transposon TNT 1-94 [Trichonephila clavipes]|nr:retrovirus-related Pol polyprotein from transposon TNT 1-94 [Trichonephila clavipes]